MTVPIYVVAAILAVITAYFSDKVGKRSPFIIGFLFMMILGYAMYVFISLACAMVNSEMIAS
jgi:MFS family permease